MLIEEVPLKLELSMEIKNRIIYKALLTRKVEELLLKLYSTGELFGTIHTCIGQEFIGAVVSEFIQMGDSVFSNHRCHGHFISIFKDVYGLIAEIYGKKSGVCGGKGGSQHLFKNGFYSNGIQGGIVPVSAGLAFAKKIQKNKNISVVFIGDGTLGEGAFYETLNLCSKWKLPLVFVLENNLYAQSTHQSEVMAGDICARAQAFGLHTAYANTWDWENLYENLGKLTHYSRTYSLPSFIQIDTYRLHAHSKGDDNRDPEEVKKYSNIDPLNLIIANNDSDYSMNNRKINALLVQAVEEAKVASCSDILLTPLTPLKWKYDNNNAACSLRVGHAINDSLRSIMAENEKVYFIGEDVRSPYGGAFKISQGLSDCYPDRVLNTPISESAIVGIGTGLALEGYRPIIEIMFGDFITLAMDQIINHAAKFRYMYNEQVRVPLIIRTPMGGRRGYGPTHSQTLDRHLLGIPGLRVIAINNMIHPKIVYQTVLDSSEDPTIIIENKILYTLSLREIAPEGFFYKMLYDPFPVVMMEPESSHSDICIIGYGGLSDLIIDVIVALFLEFDIVAQFICPIQIYPFSINSCFDYIKKSKAIVLIEEGQGFAGFGAEMLAQIHVLSHDSPIRATRIYAAESRIPASKNLENEVLPGKEKIIDIILEFLKKDKIHVSN